MKNSITFLIIIFCFQFINAQEFKKTEKYTITAQERTKQKEYETTLLDVISTEEDSIKIATLSILNIDFLEDINISILSKPNLENIDEVIKVDVNYNTCCNHTETYYFMVTNENDFISLPLIENVYCEDSVSETEYIFPVQTLGKENTILKTTVSFTENHSTKDVEVIQSFVLNDDEYINNYEIDYSEVLMP